MTNAAQTPQPVPAKPAANPNPNPTAAPASPGAKSNPDPKADSTQQSKPGSPPLPGLKPRTTGLRPCAIMFLSGPYKGWELDMGVAIIESEQDQTAEWKNMQGMSLRVGKNFTNVSTAAFRLTLEYYSATDDISEWTENCKCLQEIDPQTGQAPTLLYAEGKIKVAPLICTSVKIKKDYPFVGGKGFHHAKVDISLEVLGGKTSEHRFAPPFVETELTRLRQNLTQAQRDRLGTQAVAQEKLAACLTQEENGLLGDIMKSNQFDNVDAVKALAQKSPSGLLQAATAGLIPKEVLAKVDVQLQQAIAIELAKKQDGIANAGNSTKAALANAILGQASSLPSDLQALVPGLREAQESIHQAILNQTLDTNAPVWVKAPVAEQLIRVAKCGLTMRNSGSTKIQGGNQVPPEVQSWFDSKLKDQANDSKAREKLILDELNKMLGDKDITDEAIQSRLGLSSPEQAALIKKSRPYKSKEEFIKRFGKDSGINGNASWDSFTTYAAANSSASPF